MENSKKESLEDFKLYVEKFSKKHNLSIEESLEYMYVKLYGNYLGLDEEEINEFMKSRENPFI